MKSKTEHSNLAQIGSWKFPEKKFLYEKSILIKQTNLFGNTYFSNYIEWQGEAREKLFLSHPAALDFLKENLDIFLVTHTLHHEFISNTFFGDKLRIELTTKNILDYSFVINFQYFNNQTNQLVGKGWQKICFINRVSNQPCKVPQLFLDIAIPIQEV